MLRNTLHYLVNIVISIQGLRITMIKPQVNMKALLNVFQEWEKIKEIKKISHLVVEYSGTCLTPLGTSKLS